MHFTNYRFVAIGIGLLIFILILLTSVSYKDSPELLKVSGTIELTSVDLSFKIPGRVVKRLVDEGDLVSQGNVIATLDDSLLKQQVAIDAAAVLQAKAALDELKSGYRPEEVAQSKALVHRAMAEMVKQNQDYKRQKQLFEKEVISSREFEAISAALKEAQARLREQQEYYQQLKSGYRKEQIAQAKARLKQALHTKKLSKLNLNDAILVSPLEGTVLSKNIEAGEVVAPGTPVMTIGNLDQVWLRAYIDERDLGKVQLGQNADVTTDTFPGKKYQGKITFISQEAEFTPKNVQTEKERVKLVYRIKITLENPSHELKPGMPADAEIHLRTS